MKQMLFLAIIAIFTIPLLTAQEISASQFQAQIVNQRYVITYRAPTDNSNSDATYDIVMFARDSELSEWFRLSALVGDYRDIREGYSGKILWEPILDYHKLTRYEFKLVALNKLYLSQDYQYESTEEVGFLNAYSDLSDTVFQVDGVRAGFQLPLALPAGNHTVYMYSGRTLLNQESISLRHLSLTEVDLTPGTMTLEALQTGVTYAINGQTYTNVRDMKLPSGVYEVTASLENPTAGKISKTVSLTVLSRQKTKHTFDMQFGYLNLSSNRIEAVHYIDEVKATKIKNLPLTPGLHNLKAILVTTNSWLNNYSVSKEIYIDPGDTIDVAMDFEVGKLTFTGSELGLLYVLHPVNVQQGDAAQKLYSPDALLPITNFSRNWKFAGHSYYLSDTAMAWKEANVLCQSLGGHQVTIGSAAENDITFQNTTGTTWLGLTDEAVEGTFSWVTGEPLAYTNWAKGEPNNQGNEDFAHIRFRDNGPKWNDAAGGNSEKAYAVLEYDFINKSNLPDGIDLKDAMRAVWDLEVPAGEYDAYAVLPQSNTQAVDLVIKKNLKISAGESVTNYFKFDFAYLIFKSKVALPSLTIDTYRVAVENELKLLAGTHKYSAQASELYHPLIDAEINLKAGEHRIETIRLQKNKAAVAKMNRRQFALQYGNGLLLKTIEYNNYYGVASSSAGSTDFDAIMSSTGRGYTLSGMQVRAGSTFVKESENPYSVKFPSLHYGFGILDKVTFVKPANASKWGVMYDLLTVNTGVAFLSKGGNIYSALDLTGIWGSQMPILDDSGPYMFATLDVTDKFKDRNFSHSDFQFGVEAKYQIGWRVFKENYLHLHAGVRLMDDHSGDWYLRSDLENWKDNPSASTPLPVHNVGLPTDNVAFEGPSFYLGIGWDNGFTSPRN